MQAFIPCLGFVLLLMCTSALVHVTGGANSEDHTRPARCNRKAERFKSGHKYTYTYQTNTTSGRTGDTAATPDSQLLCRVVVLVPRKCELILEVLGCELLEQNASQDLVINYNSQRLATELMQHSVYLHYNEGEVASHQIAVVESEPQHVTNIKRAIISVLQLKVTSHPKTKESTFPLHDVFGTCQAHMNASRDHRLSETFRDLAACNLSHVSNSPAGILSIIKSSKQAHKFSPITELMYPFELSVACKYFVTPASRIEAVHCVQKQAYNPWLAASGAQGRASMQISQHMKLEAENVLMSQTVNSSSTGRIWVDLAMEFSPAKEGSRSQDVMEELELTVVDFLGQDLSETTAISFSASSFRTLVETMREAPENELQLVKETVYSCHNSPCGRHASRTYEPKLQQSIEERLFYNGLMSCGTDSCLAVFAASIRDGMIPYLEASIVVYNMGLFYQPSTKVAHIILEYCRKIDSQGCWLSLSAMIHRLTSDVNNNLEANKIIFEAISHIHRTIEDKCQRGSLETLSLLDKTLASEKLLTAIKAISNIGETAMNFYHEKIPHDKSVTSLLMRCIENDQLSFTIARSAAQAVKSCGLEGNIAAQLLAVVEDEKRPFPLRTAIFDILIEHNDEPTLRSLLNILNTTKTKNMQTYITTRVAGLMESQQPKFHKLQIKLLEIMKDRVLPPLDEGMAFKSRYTQYSHQFTVPIVTTQTGGYLVTNLIYTPASSVFQSFTLRIGWILNNRTFHLFDILVDLEGMDTFLEMFNQKSSANLNFTDPENILHLLDIIQKYLHDASQAEMPNFAHYSRKVKLVLKEIFQLVNMKKGSFPQAHISLKVFGYEMGFVSSDSLLLKMKEVKQKGELQKSVFRLFPEEIQTMFLRAFSLIDFHKVVPTVAGFPLETRIDSTVVAKMFVAAKIYKDDFIKYKKQLRTNFALSSRLSAVLQVSMKVSVGEYTSTGTSTKTSGVGMVDWSGLVKYLPPGMTSDLTRDLNIVWDLEQKPFTFFYTRNDQSFIINDEEFPVNQSGLEKTFEKCLPDFYSQVFGYKTCVSGTSYSPPGSSLDISSLLVNPFKVEAVLTPADKDLKYYSLQLKYQKRTLQQKGYTMTANFEGPGREFSRRVSANVDNDYDTGVLDITVNIPDAGVNYNLERVSFSNNHDHHKKYASVLSRHGKVLSSFILEKKGSHLLKVTSPPGSKFMETKKSIHFNISFGALSLDVFYKDHVPIRTNWITDLAVSYYCEPKLGLLYALHPNKTLAAANDHTSTLTYKQHTFDSKTSFSETWKGNNKMVITIPGQNFTMRTDMVADLEGAQRVTDLYWSDENTTDYIHMNSSVHNQSTQALFNFDYFLHLNSKDKFEIDIEGHVRGPRAAPLAMLNISTDISFSTARKRSEPLLLSILSQMKNMGTSVSQEAASIYEASKSKLFSWWSGRRQKPDKDYTEAKTKERTQLTENQKSVSQLFLESLNWNMAIDTQIRMAPHMITEPGGRKKKAGSEIHWLVNASMPRGYNKVFLVNGSIFRGKMLSMKLLLEDYFHDLRFNWKAEHSNTPEIFHHHHSWTLVETSKHSYDRSFSFTVKLEHYRQFEYDLILRSPRTNATHHINYTRLSPTDHTVRAFAKVHSEEPKFDLLYNEASNVSENKLVTDITLVSDYINPHFHLEKLTKPDGVTIDGTLDFTSGRPKLRDEQTGMMHLQVVFPRRHPPTCEWTYRYKNRPVINVVLSMLGPNKITVGVKTLFPNVTSIQNPIYSVKWTLELMESRYLQHTVEFSQEMLGWMKYTARELHKEIPGTVKHLRDNAINFILADFKDTKLPFLNKNVEEWLKILLQKAMKADPESKMTKTKMYKLALGGVNALNTIWLDSPIVRLIKGGHLDQAVAGSIKTLTDVLVDWTVHPPFMIGQFGKIYIQPILNQAMRSKLMTFSTPLPFVMPAFNRMPQLTVLERAVVGLVKDRIIGTATVSKDMAVILNGHTIKTFDGRFFHITEPLKPSCTYLLGGDFKRGQFGLTYTKEGVTIFSSRFGITLAHDGSVFPVNDHQISNLPYSTPDGQLSLSLHGGEVQLSFAGGLVDVTFNPDSNLYLISLDRKLRNVSLGLLGTNNHESSDDFLLANGSTTTAERDLLNSYELTKTKKCLVTSVLSPVLCEKLDFPSCMRLSNKPPHNEACQLVLNPQPFIDECLKSECTGQSGCGAVQGYFAACRHHGFKVDMPAFCDRHQHKSGLDLVVVQSLHHSVIRDKDPLTVCHTLLASLAHLDLSVGLVTYGGAGEWKKPKLHILNGKLMEKGKRAAQYMDLAVSTGEDEAEAAAAVLAAAEYPFRSQSVKVILLVHQRKKNDDTKKNADLLDVLRAKSITLVSVSMYPELEVSRAPGILTAKEVLELGGKSPSPQDLFSDVVISTAGMWLDLDVLNSRDKHKNKKLAKAFARMDI